MASPSLPQVGRLPACRKAAGAAAKRHQTPAFLPFSPPPPPRPGARPHGAARPPAPCPRAHGGGGGGGGRPLGRAGRAAARVAGASHHAGRRLARQGALGAPPHRGEEATGRRRRWHRWWRWRRRGQVFREPARGWGAAPWWCRRRVLPHGGGRPGAAPAAPPPPPAAAAAASSPPAALPRRCRRPLEPPRPPQGRQRGPRAAGAVPGEERGGALR